MSVLAANNPTLLDLAARLGPDGNIDTIIELLAAENPILQDLGWQEGNLPTGHVTTVRTGLPAPTWRKLYGGVQPTKSTTAKITDSCGMLEAYAEVDKALADLNNNTTAFRMSEDAAHVEGMSQEMATKVFYGNEGVTPEAFTGLAPRFNSLAAANAFNIIDAGGTGSDNTSIWLCVWGPQTGFGIYPKGSRAGLQFENKGQVTIENVDGNGGRMEAYRSHYRWDAGLVVRDWRYFGRIANIDVSTLQTDINSAKLLIQHMIRLSTRVKRKGGGAGRAVWYVNQTVMENLRLGILEKIANNLLWDTIAGEPVMKFDGIPVRQVDALLNTEARVV